MILPTFVTRIRNWKPLFKIVCADKEQDNVRLRC
jgi:hypothetical protein